MMLELLQKYCDAVNADKEILGDTRKVVDFFIALQESVDLEALPGEKHPIYPMYQEFNSICNNGFLNADNIIYKDVYYALIFLCYAAKIEKPFKRKFILDSLLLLHNGYMDDEKGIGAFANETRSDELLPSINAAIIARLVPEIGKFLAENNLFPADMPLNQLLVDNDDPGTQKNVHEMLKFYLSDKFTVKEQIEILSGLFLDRDCKDRLERLLKYNREAAGFVVDQVVDNAKLSETLYPIVLKFIKLIGAGEGKTLLKRLTSGWDIVVRTLAEELFFGGNVTLYYNNMQISLNQINIIADALKQNNTLLQLYLPCNKIGDAGANYIADALKNNKTLLELYLQPNQIRAVGANYIADALKQNDILLKLNLGGNQIGNVGANYIADALKQNNILLKLSLRENEIEDEGAKCVGDALKQNNTLSELSLSHDKIGNVGAKYIGDALKQNTGLSKLNLGYNQIGDAGAKSIADALKKNKTLLELYLEHNQIGYEGAKYIADALKKNKTLLKLHLKNQQIGVAVVKALYEAILSSERTTTFYCDMFTIEQQKQVDEIANWGGFADKIKLERKISSELCIYQA